MRTTRGSSRLSKSSRPAGRAIYFRRAALGALLLVAAPGVASGQVFIATQPKPEFTVGPLFVRANVAPKQDAVDVNVLWSLVTPQTGGGAAAQDLFLLWPGEVD